MSELEQYSEETRFIFTSFSVAFLAFTAIALVALNRTKHTPKAARFLSSALLSLDFLAVFTYTVRRYVTDTTTNVAVQVIGVGWSLLALITIGIMSIERFIVFNFAQFYLNYVSLRKIKRIVTLTWVIESFAYFFIRYGVCYIMYPDASPYDVVGKCNKVSYIYLICWLVIIITVSITCYVKIFGNIRYQCKFDKGQLTLRRTIINSIRQYKSTSIVILYLLTMLATTTLYAIGMTAPVTQTAKRINIDLINVFNCVMNPCMYVVWFRECRLEMFKIFSCIIPNASIKIQSMRIEVLSIVTSECVCQKNNSTVSRKSFSSGNYSPNNKGTKPSSEDIDAQLKSEIFQLKNEVLQYKNGDKQVNGMKHGNVITPLSKIHI